MSEKAKEYLKKEIPDGKITDKFGNEIIVNVDQLIDHVIPVNDIKKFNSNIGRVEFIKLFKDTLQNPDGVVVNILEAPGSKDEIKGMVKLDKNYTKKIGNKKWFIVSVNSSKEYPSYTGWTFMISDGKMKGLLIRPKK